MSFLIYDIGFLIVFCLVVFIFLYRNRANLKREGILYLYRTKIGLKIIDYIGNKYKKTLSVLQYLSIICGYGLMVFVCYFFFKLLYIFATNVEFVRALKVPPLTPLIPYLPSVFKLDFLPPFYFTYWIIAIAIVAIGHEFAHGIFARFNDVRVKSTGFGFLGPFLAAFVEPDEKQIEKKGARVQLSILSAGTFANIILTLIFLVLLAGFFMIAFVPSGTMFNTYTFTGINVSSIDKIGNLSVSNLSSYEKLSLMSSLKPEKIINIDSANLSLIKIYAGNTSYLGELSVINSTGKNSSIVIVYDNMPAINAGMKGAITEFNKEKIKTSADLGKELLKSKPGESVEVKTFYQDKEIDYNITLGEDPATKGKAYLGIGVYEVKTSNLLGKVYKAALFFKDPNTYYKARDGEGIIFIYNLLWWVCIINFSVALFNMLPAGIFDGGRFFYFTILKITGKKRFAEISFKVATYAVLLVLALLMVFWGLAFR